MEAEARSATVHLKEVAQIALTVRDLGRAKAFYRNMLGIKFLFDAGSMAFFQIGSVRLMLGLAEQDVTPAGTILYFRVEDIASTHAAMVKAGVTFSQPPHLIAKMPDHDLWMAFLADPDGNIIGLMSELART